jgi:hypothetical protein
MAAVYKARIGAYRVLETSVDMVQPSPVSDAGWICPELCSPSAGSALNPSRSQET